MCSYIYDFAKSHVTKLSCFANMELHIGNEIKAVFERKGMSVTEFGRRLNYSRENVYHIFNRQTIDTGLLLSISAILEFDFFSLYVQQLNPGRDSEVDRLKKENKMLEELVDLLKKSKKNWFFNSVEIRQNHLQHTVTLSFHYFFRTICYFTFCFELILQ